MKPWNISSFLNLLVLSLKEIYGDNCLIHSLNSTVPCPCCKSGYGDFNCTTVCQNCQTRILSGKGCFQKCTDGYYGKTCNMICSTNCNKGNSGRVICNKEDGLCFNGCRPGYFGRQCDLRCSRRCNNSECYQNDGRCNICKEERYYGSHCRLDCPSGCIYGICNKDGQCTRGCKMNYFGEMCTFPCGPNCKISQCNGQISNKFNCTDGCKNGYTSYNCSTECPDNCIKCDQHTVSCMICAENTDKHCDNGVCTCRAQVTQEKPLSPLPYILLCISFLAIFLVVSVLWRKRKCHFHRRHRESINSAEPVSLMRKRTSIECGNTHISEDVDDISKIDAIQIVTVSFIVTKQHNETLEDPHSTSVNPISASVVPAEGSLPDSELHGSEEMHQLFAVINSIPVIQENKIQIKVHRHVRGGPRQ